MEPTSQSKTATYYAQNALEYFERTNDLDLGAVYEPFERRLKPGSRILDLGCGSGRDARHFAAQGRSVVALDPCRELLALAARHTPSDLRDRILFVIGSAPELGFSDDQFDAIWACGSLLHLSREEVLPALAECRRILRPSGLFFLAVKARDENKDADERARVLWNPDELGRVAAETPFEVLSISKVDSLDGRDVTWINMLLKNA